MSERAGARPKPFAAVATFAVALGGGWAALNPWQRMSMMRGRRGPMAPVEPAVTTPLLAFAALALALAVSVWLAPRYPRICYIAVVVLTAAYLYVGGPVPAALPAPAIALAVLVRRRSPSEALAWAMALLPTFTILAARDPAGFADDPIPVLGVVLFAVAWVVLPAVVAASLSSRRAASAQRRADELRQVAYEERLRVARDIHDVVGHSLSMISLQSGVALHVLDTDPAQVRASLEAIRDASKSSLAELRQTLGVFRSEDGDQPLVPAPSLAAVPALVDSLRSGGTDVALAMPADAAQGVGAGAQTVAYRVIQEGLTNVVRHAGVASAAVSVERRPDALVVGVRDNGSATAAPVEGAGLRGMRERVEALGGRLTVTARPGGGLAVEATLPIGDPGE